MDLDSDSSTALTYQKNNSAPQFPSSIPPIHTPLETAYSTRLIKLEPGPEADPLTITLIQVKLPDFAPPYDAISYVWGDPTQKISISCNQRLFSITTNLHWALHRVRHPQDAIYVWADAVCINQSDLAERSRQVGLMGAIYGHARRVYLAMGEADDAEQVAALVNGCKLSWPNGMPRLSDWDPLRDDQRWCAVAGLMDRPWFKRVWVVQEAGLANEPVVLYGRAMFGYRDLLGVVGWARNQPWAMKFRIPGLLVHQAWSNWRPQTLSHDSPSCLLTLINHAAMLQCSDPRDHVYAFLGHPLAVSNDGKNHAIVPDYEKDYQEVYREVSIFLLREYGLELFTSVEHNAATISEQLPSWVCRWNVSLVNNDISTLRGPKIVSETMWQASRAWSLSMKINVDSALQGNNLSLQGMILDQVRSVYIIFCVTKDQTGMDVQFLSTAARNIVGFEGLIEQLKIELQSDPRAAVMQTLCAGDYNGSLSRLASSSTSSMDDRNLYESSVSAACYNRSFFVTTQGHFGLGPVITQPGDVCYLLVGATAPMMMRPVHENKCRLLGEVYLHGGTDNTMLDGIYRGEIRTTEVVVC